MKKTCYCLTCGFFDTYSYADIDGLQYEIIYKWLFPYKNEGSCLPLLFPDIEVKPDYIGYCSKECRYVAMQPIQDAMYFKSLPVRISSLNIVRRAVDNRTVPKAYDGSYMINNRGSKSFYKTKEEAEKVYDTNEFLVYISKTNKTRKELLAKIKLPQLSEEDALREERVNAPVIDDYEDDEDADELSYNEGDEVTLNSSRSPNQFISHEQLRAARERMFSPRPRALTMEELDRQIDQIVMDAPINAYNSVYTIDGTNGPGLVGSIGEGI